MIDPLGIDRLRGIVSEDRVTVDEEVAAHLPKITEHDDRAAVVPLEAAAASLNMTTEKMVSMARDGKIALYVEVPPNVTIFRTSADHIESYNKTLSGPSGIDDYRHLGGKPRTQRDIRFLKLTNSACSDLALTRRARATEFIGGLFSRFSSPDERPYLEALKPIESFCVFKAYRNDLAADFPTESSHGKAFALEIGFSSLYIPVASIERIRSNFLPPEERYGNYRPPKNFPSKLLALNEASTRFFKDWESDIAKKRNPDRNAAIKIWLKSQGYKDTLAKDTAHLVDPDYKRTQGELKGVDYKHVSTSSGSPNYLEELRDQNGNAYTSKALLIINETFELFSDNEQRSEKTEERLKQSKFTGREISSILNIFGFKSETN